MLGRHADAFFAKHMSERVLAGTPNGLAQSIAFPDRELAGTGKVQRVSGYYEMPGPQNSVSANAMIPGMQGAEMMPGMGYGDAMPGMWQLATKQKPIQLTKKLARERIAWYRSQLRLLKSALRKAKRALRPGEAAVPPQMLERYIDSYEASIRDLSSQMRHLDGFDPGLAGMGYADALPGMGYADALPGMGQLDVKRIGMYALIGVGGIMAWRWYQGRQRVAVKVRRSQRRRGRRRRR